MCTLGVALPVLRRRFFCEIIWRLRGTFGFGCLRPSYDCGWDSLQIFTMIVPAVILVFIVGRCARTFPIKPGKRRTRVVSISTH